MSATIVTIDPLLGEPGASEIVALCEAFGSYGMYSQESVDSEIGRGLTQRHDSVMNFLRTGGRFGRSGTVAELAARTNYFRAEYAYGPRVLAAGIEAFLGHEGFVEAARALYDRPIVEPAIVYANLLVPGQELTVHTDVPEFRGANRKVMPQWLLVAMHHSGLFAEHRISIATGIAWFHDKAQGSELAVYLDGPDAPPLVHAIAYDSAMVLDTDSVFHGVDPVGIEVDLPALVPGMTLDFLGKRSWAVHDRDDEIARWGWDELRFSVSWKAYCFADEAEQRSWRDHADDLTIDTVLDTIVDDLRARGVVGRDPARDRELALTIIDTYIRFPSV